MSKRKVESSKNPALVLQLAGNGMSKYGNVRNCPWSFDAFYWQRASPRHIGSFFFSPKTNAMWWVSKILIKLLCMECVPTHQQNIILFAVLKVVGMITIHQVLWSHVATCTWYLLSIFIKQAWFWCSQLKSKIWHLEQQDDNYSGIKITDWIFIFFPLGHINFEHLGFQSQSIW